VLRFHCKPSKRRSYELDQRVAEYSIKEIDLEMPRALFRGQLISTLWKDPGIRALLLRHLVEVPELGYCEGMHLVAAVFSKASSSHDEAWDAHVASGRQASRYFRWVHNLKLWQKKRPWYGHLLKNSVEASMFLPQALMTMFTMWLPLETVVACLALVEDTGFKAMVAI